MVAAPTAAHLSFRLFDEFLCICLTLTYFAFDEFLTLRALGASVGSETIVTGGYTTIAVGTKAVAAVAVTVAANRLAVAAVAAE